MATSKATAVELSGVSVRYGGLAALDKITLSVKEGEKVALAGPSGAGKSTLLSVIGAGLEPAEGAVRIFGENPAALGARRRRLLQRKFGVVYQQFGLCGPLKAIHNVNAGRLATWSLAKSLWSLFFPQGRAEVAAALNRVGIAGKIDVRADRLSGGEQQRVAIARMLISDPKLMLADEPVSSLDPARGVEVVELLCTLAGEGRTLIASLHAWELALGHFDRIIGLREGRIIFDLPAGAVTAEQANDLYRITAAAS